MFRTLSLILTALASNAAAAADQPVPRWFMAGSDPADYAAAKDSAVAHGGGTSARLNAAPGSSDGFGTLMQQVQPGDLAGHRVRLSGWVRTEQVGGWSGLWMRVDGPGAEMLSFDNMQSRPIKGTQDWSKVAIVLDVPVRATAVSFGVLLAGNKGTVWIDDLSIDLVGDGVPATGTVATSLASEPTNLSFEM